MNLQASAFPVPPWRESRELQSDAGLSFHEFEGSSGSKLRNLLNMIVIFLVEKK